MAARQHIRFLFGDEMRTIADFDPTRTVLDWLRLEERLTGTKEGCAEGDCGACTVLVGRPVETGVKYESVNTCIRFLGTLDGCHLVTVEQLAGADGKLHPVQQAMIDCHGAQCGFCTPGFVMSLASLWLNEDAPDEDRIEEALQGNLCRCTGYAPIVRAAQRMYELADRSRDRLIANRDKIAQQLAELRDENIVEIAHESGRRFIAPATADQLAKTLTANPDATMVAGATDVGLWVTKFMRVLDPVVYLGRVAELNAIDVEKGGIRIGAGVSYSDAWPVLAGEIPALDELLRRLGGEQVRNMGTIGGNIANGSPIGDTPPPFIALGAQLTLRRGDDRRTIALEDFFVDYGKQDRAPDEFVESVFVPLPGDDARFAVYKISKRIDEDITAVCGAFYLELEYGAISEARIAFGGMAATPKRAPKAEAALKGKPWSEVAVENAMSALADDYTPLDDWRASADYRRRVAANLLKRFYIESSEAGVATRVTGRRREAAHV